MNSLSSACPGYRCQIRNKGGAMQDLVEYGRRNFDHSRFVLGVMIEFGTVGWFHRIIVGPFGNRGFQSFLNKLAVPLWIGSEEHTSELQSQMRMSYCVFCLIQHPSTIVRQSFRQ